mmetsp:Transcript_73740/g.216406  ORF Transcript_73740/g.216406 Transcript_73740/m.216406 type:complete len:224 (+) Transcript_73740:216-887(+)
MLRRVGGVHAGDAAGRGRLGRRARGAACRAVASTPGAGRSPRAARARGLPDRRALAGGGRGVGGLGGARGGPGGGSRLRAHRAAPLAIGHGAHLGAVAAAGGPSREREEGQPAALPGSGRAQAPCRSPGSLAGPVAGRAPPGQPGGAGGAAAGGQRRQGLAAVVAAGGRAGRPLVGCLVLGREAGAHSGQGECRRAGSHARCQLPSVGLALADADGTGHARCR